MIASRHTIYRGKVDEVLEAKIALKGEFTCVLGPKDYVLLLIHLVKLPYA